MIFTWAFFIHVFMSQSIDFLYQKFKESTGVSTDTRTINDGQMFFALKGENFDAGAFVEQAFNQGASHVVTQREDWLDHDSVSVVEDVLVALQTLARHHRRTLNTPIIGLTGSNGKTTTKELLFVSLNTKYNVFKTQGNYNNHIGVPLSLLSIHENHDLAIIEMGANKPGDIQELAEIAEPNYGIITNIGDAHLELLGSRQGVFETKTALYRFVKQSGKLVFVNAKDEPLLSYARSLGLDIVLYNEEESRVKAIGPSFNMQLIRQEEDYDLDAKLFGTFNAENYICAADVGAYFDVPYQLSIEALSSYEPNMMRSQTLKFDHNVLFLDAYNANPTSMKASISVFEDEAKKTCLMLGDMKELGKASVSFHQELIDYLMTIPWHRVDLVGKDFSACQSPYKCYDDVDQLISHLDVSQYRDKLIFIKASRSIKLEKVLDSFKDA